MDDGKLTPSWLAWARQIQAISQTGLHFTTNEFDRERYLKLQRLAAEMVSMSAGIVQEEVLRFFQLGEGYATPKVDVRGAVFNPQGELLMVQEKVDGGWTLPGGWADIDDFPAGGAEREVLEETGYQVKAQKLVGVYDSNRDHEFSFNHAYKLVFLCALIGGEAAESSETTNVGWFPKKHIPHPFSKNRTVARHIEDVFTALEDPAWNAVFD